IAVEPAREQPTKRDDFIEWARATMEAAGAKGRVRKIAGDHSSCERAGADKADYTFSSAVHMTGTPIGKLQLGEEIAVAYTKRGDQLEAVEINTGEEARRIIFEDITVRVASQVLELEPGAEVEHKYLLYNGPLKVRLLGDVPGVSEAAVTRYTDELHLYTFTDQASPGVFGTIGK